MSAATLCELLGVSRSWYYAAPQCVETAQRDVELRDAIEKVVLEFPGYGYRRATWRLEREGWVVERSGTTSECCGCCERSRRCADSNSDT